MSALQTYEECYDYEDSDEEEYPFTYEGNEVDEVDEVDEVYEANMNITNLPHVPDSLKITVQTLHANLSAISAKFDTIQKVVTCIIDTQNDRLFNSPMLRKSKLLSFRYYMKKHNQTFRKIINKFATIRCSETNVYNLLNLIRMDCQELESSLRQELDWIFQIKRRIEILNKYPDENIKITDIAWNIERIMNLLTRW